MECQIIPIQQLTNEQVAELAKLHHAMLHSLLAELGLPFVERYYRIAGKDDSAIGFCALSENGELLAWVVGSSKPEQVNGQIREPLTWFIPQLMRVLLKRPSLIQQLLISARSKSFELKPDCIELVYLGVSPYARKHGLGMELIKVFAEASVESFRSISLSVEKENANAIRLYTRAGFVITDTFVEGKFRRHRMEKRIGHEIISEKV
jgi:ribosomal protein S18 acetylase RimI-like enzyme